MEALAVLWAEPEDSRAEEQEIEFSWGPHVGTVVHRCPQRLAEDELRGWDAGRVDSLSPQFAKELQRRGVPAEDLKRAFELVVRALGSTLADERGRWILGHHPEARSELRMRVRSPLGTRTFVMDRVFRSSDATQWWLTSRPVAMRARTSKRSSMPERNRYTSQLSIYVSALGTRGVIFTSHSILVEKLAMKLGSKLMVAEHKNPGQPDN